MLPTSEILFVDVSVSDLDIGSAICGRRLRRWCSMRTGQ